MALVVEDGTGKVDSNVYADVATARAYAADRGVALPAADGDVAVLLFQASDYVEAKRAQYQGAKTWPVATTDPVHVAQAMQWPRVGVYIDGSEIEFPSDAIPRELVAAQCQAVMELHAGRDLMPSSDGRIVKRQKVDVIEKEFFSGTESGTSGVPTPVFPKVDALLAPLFDGDGQFALSTVRL
jgi:DnaT-like ssDNA binding protein